MYSATSFMGAVRALYAKRFGLAPSTPSNYGIDNNVSVNARNAANTADVPMVKVGTDNNLRLLDSAGGSRMIVNSTAKTIVDGSATGLFEVACAAGEIIGGAIFYHVVASDGTDHQSLVGMVNYAAVNKAGTLTLAITEAAANQAKAVSSGTLTLAWTFATGTGKGTVKLQPTGSLTETTYTVTYTVVPFAGSVTVL